MILCNNSAVAKFSGYSNVLGVSSFPSLSNDGELLVLKNSNGNTIHFLNYNSSWHTDNLKKNGGWSLEMALHSQVREGAHGPRARFWFGFSIPDSRYLLTLLLVQIVMSHIRQCLYITGHNTVLQ